VGSKAFALAWEGRGVLKLDKAHQEFLFEVRPDTFTKFRVGTGHWSCVELSHLDDAELADLVREAWSQVVPKKVSRPVLEAAGAARPA
jgi:hypothetical protein